ncbi:hypothetical protein KK141_19410 [Dyella sp. LX-66]|uniref:hypothetical protein n=1 Tax=unclassified Dyella TaxID=2634549 RepID=UPI001BE0CE54|nr:MULTISPECIES: hypothetical protein [unclassified Dyella]MBT2119559.1 hypothetical protein [Dyella sp. LX-1]MBT2141725.1 hypothetical protein [Dyella sp. LX-66]
MVYQEWGFRRSPFDTTSLPASEIGSQLLKGRDKEVAQLMRRISTGPKLATLEGLNGVGKTSVANVAAFRLFESHLEGGDGALFVPCKKVFQLDADQDLQTFIDGVLMEVAQTLIERAKDIYRADGKSISTTHLDRWLNSPQLKTYNAAGLGFQLGANVETNTSSGFQSSGLRKIVFEWLQSVFPSQEDGGVVCIIDNLELLQSSDRARGLLEALRDELFNVRGLRWVLCGALGIVHGVVASPRLEGYLHNPVEVGGIDATFAPAILDSRVQSTAARDNTYLPLISSDFGRLFEVLRGNLRSVLGQADNYCQWVADRSLPLTDEEKHALFETWLLEQAELAHVSVKRALGPRAWSVFTKAVEIGGLFSPSDFEQFGFNSIPALRPHIRDLEATGVMVSTQDDGDKRRKTIQITPKGWLVDLAEQAGRPKLFPNG